MRSLAVIVGVVVIVVLLVTSGTVGGALCVRGVGCVYSSDGALGIDDRGAVTVNAARP